MAVGDLPRRVADRRGRRARIDDVFVHADFDHVTGTGRLRVDAGADARVLVPELGIDVAAGETVAVERVEPWSAEVPRLYDAHGRRARASA